MIINSDKQKDKEPHILGEKNNNPLLTEAQ